MRVILKNSDTDEQVTLDEIKWQVGDMIDYYPYDNQCMTVTGYEVIEIED